MSDLLDAADKLVADLRAVGVRAVDDPRSTQSLPCALLQRPSIVPLGNLCQNLRVEWTLWLLVGGGDNRATWRLLESMREKVWALLKQQITSCSPDLYPVNEKADVPAYRITFETVL